MQPRLIASYGEAGIVYRYSGRDNFALPWTPALLEIREMIEAVHGSYNYCLLNRYRSGSDSMGWHADDEPDGERDRITFFGSDPEVSHPAQCHQKDPDISGRPWNLDHHGWNHATVLAA